MTIGGRGLNLGQMTGVTDAEKSAFRVFYDRVQGGAHPGLEFYLNNDPDAFKAYRAFADAGTPPRSRPRTSAPAAVASCRSTH